MSVHRMTPPAFIEKWRKVQLSERSAAQQHFLDLCDLLGQETPAAADPEGTHYTFERGVRLRSDKRGWADVWKKDFFAWEYKSKGKSLDDAYGQLLRYREDLNNPPLLVVSDISTSEIHTNFTRTAKKSIAYLWSPWRTPRACAPSCAACSRTRTSWSQTRLGRGSRRT